jgi:hypothetical protein
MHALHGPMTTGCVGEPVDIERSRRDVETGVGSSGLVGVFGEQIDLDDRLDVGEARLAWIAPLGYAPVDLGRSCVGPRFDAAVPLLDNGLADDFFRQSGTEVVSDLGFEGRLVALEGEQVIGLMFDDLVGDRDLAAHGVDGHQRALELAGFGQVVEELGNGSLFIGLLGHAERPRTSRALLA